MMYKNYLRRFYPVQKYMEADAALDDPMFTDVEEVQERLLAQSPALSADVFARFLGMEVAEIVEIYRNHGASDAEVADFSNRFVNFCLLQVCAGITLAEKEGIGMRDWLRRARGDDGELRSFYEMLTDGTKLLVTGTPTLTGLQSAVFAISNDLFDIHFPKRNLADSRS